MMDVGTRVQLRSLPESVGIIAGMVDTPNFGPLPLVAWDDTPDYPEPHGVEELRVIERRAGR